jgi:hypothetical protein
MRLGILSTFAILVKDYIKQKGDVSIFSLAMIIYGGKLRKEKK